MVSSKDLTLLGAAAGGAALVAILMSRQAQAEPPIPPGDDPIAKGGTGLYMPVYSTAMGQATVDVKNAFPRLPVWANVNPASGPGDVYTGHTGPRSDIQARINAFRNFPNMIISGYTGTWYAGALDSPPTGSNWPGIHFGVVYTQSEAQYNQIISSGGKAILLQDVADKYAGLWYTGINAIMMDEVYSGTNTNKQNWYKQYIDYCRSVGLVKTRGNPGTSAPLKYFEDGWFDILAIYEGSGVPSITTIRNRTGGGQYAKKANVTAHHVSTLTRTQVMQLAPEVAYTYITHDGGDGNPYDHPSTHLMNLAQWLDEYNVSVGAY